jgi:hypothetical protein
MYVQVEMFTTDYIINGYINTPGERLSDVLNIKNETGLVVNDAQVSRLLALGKSPPNKFIEARIEKKHLLFACPAAKDITQKSMFRKSFRQLYDVEMLVPGFEIIGQIHLTEKFDLRRVLNWRQDDFIPLTNATATYAFYPALTYFRETIIVNKTLVSFLGERLRKEDLFSDVPATQEPRTQPPPT